MREFDWYEPIDFNDPDGDKVTQGDIIIECPVVKIKPMDSPPFIDPTEGANILGIVMTQACDLENPKPKVKLVSICPLIPLKVVVDDIMAKAFASMPDGKKKDDKKAGVIEDIRQGNYLDFHLIQKYEDVSFPHLNIPYSVVGLRDTYHVPVESLQKIVGSRKGKRLRLLPPYREHLAQAYTFNFNRIGLPSNINVSLGDL